MSNKRQVSASRTINASPEDIFAIISNPTKHCEIDGSGTVQGETFGPDQLTGEGQSFGMKMKFNGLPYRIKSTVKEYDENRLIAWAHFGRHRWRWELEPVDDGTVVTETFDWSTALSPKSIEIMGYPKRHQASMEATLERLDDLVTSNS
jgi:uncharacterized protein YndB with AHSA1/START domain